jgi:hypothetical protein
MIAKIRELNLDDLKTVAGGLAAPVVTINASAQMMAAPSRPASSGSVVVSHGSLNIPKLPARY